MELTAAVVVRRLSDHASAVEHAKITRRVGPGERVIGVRMGTLFEIAKEHAALPPAEVERLLAEPTYEARMAGCCILDFQARKQLGDPDLCERYLSHHDRITTWDMVDRAAPRVVGAAVAGGPYDVLHRLAGAEDPLRRRTAITAPLWFVRAGSDADVEEGFAIAARLTGDAEPVVHNAVGIFLAHAGERSGARLDEFLTQHAHAMPRPALRLATRKRR
ncbi:DNA alkylation repair protein [Nocardioides coralli]|uniref:DNA alkylation repair protein n=1 Tax=Nocardioides coralli TaxID=2872154 RepID=UPI001CA3DF5F|nr:DNA alkylation repair protein [Nocardioides coralli]QZY29592.1 DNA alkylation repair protein [Nocardioides coralli]